MGNLSAVESYRGPLWESSESSRIMDQQEFVRLKVEAGYITGQRGTFQSDKDDSYLYDKPQYLLSSEDELQRSLDLLEYFRVVGIFHPGARWGTYRRDGSMLQIYTLMPELEGCSNLTAIAEGRQKFIRKAEHQSSIDWYTDLLTREDSHVLEWFRRLDPDFDPYSKMIDNGLVFLLNPSEASHTDNWGWDKESGRLYPVDMEVVSLNGGYAQEIITNWSKGKAYES
jgi:hypothetical protein